MRWFYVVVLLATALLCSSCGERNQSHIRSMRITATEWAEGGEDDIPRRVQVAIDVQNNGAAATIQEGRMRVSYSGRTVLMLTLDERVKIPRRHDGEVMVWLRVNVARNSQTLALRNALFQHQSEGITIDWEFSLRAGVMRSRVVQAEEPLQEILSEEMLVALWSIVEEMKGER